MRRAPERGSVLPAVLGLAFGGLLLLGVGMDLARWAAAHREVAFAADAGAQAGAAQVLESALRAGDLVVDVDRAQAVAVVAAEGSRPRPGRSVAVTVAGNRVCVAITQPFPSFVVSRFASSELVRGSACAVPARG